MSYCRFGYADVYVFEHVHGYLECCGCWLGEHSYHTTDVRQFLAHLEEHRAAGHDVPADVSEGIEADWRAGAFEWADEPHTTTDAPIPARFDERYDPSPQPIDRSIQ